MSELTRRTLLLGATAIVGAFALPPVALAASAAPAAPATAARLPAWIVGTPDEFDGRAIWAATEEDAIAEWLDDMWIECECGEVLDTGEVIGPEDCCRCTHSVEALREPHFDRIDYVTNADWLRIGAGSLCSRCGYETSADLGGHAIGDEAVCEDCMTLDDWRIIDPERAAEIEAEAAS